MPPEPTVEEMWRTMLSGQLADLRRGRHLNGLLPADPRCKFCHAPFHGFGALLMHLMGRRRSTVNPNFCDFCENFARTHRGGAEVELTMLFADVRGSTTLAERMSATEFRRLLDRFYTLAYRTIVKTDGMINKLVGDEVVIFYIPGFAGPSHARSAVQAARELLHATGHSNPGGPWLPVGVGVHTGVAFVGALGEAVEGATIDFTALGDNVNITARLASRAGPGEILVTDAACVAAGIDSGNLEPRQLELKGKTEPVNVRVLRITAG